MEEILNELIGKTIASVDCSTSKDEQGDVFADWIKIAFTDGSETTLRPARWDYGDQSGIDVE